MLILPLLCACPQLVGGIWSELERFPGESTWEWIGNTLAGPGDLDGDGIPDLLVSGDPYSPPGPVVLAMSGADGHVLYEVPFPGNSWHFSGFGDQILPYPDYDGDGVPDFVVTDPNYSETHFDGGAFWVYSGSDGHELQFIQGWEFDQHLGTSLVLYPDTDGDGFPDFLTGGPEVSSQGFVENGAVFLISSATGGVLWRYDGIEDSMNFGNVLICPGDLDGDGITDFVSSAQHRVRPKLYPRLMAISGSSGATLWVFDYPNNDDYFGRVMTVTPDLNGDGLQDFLVSAELADGSGMASAGKVFLFSGADGSTLSEIEGNSPDERLGNSMLWIGDLDQDGEGEALIGTSSDLHVVRPRSGEDRGVVTLLGPEPPGSTLADLGDLDQDGVEDFGAGFPTDRFQDHNVGAVGVLSFKRGLSADQGSFSAAAGGVIHFSVDFPDSEAGMDYRVLASYSGDGPTDWFGVEIPLGLDPLLWRSRYGSGLDFLDAPSGILDAHGDASFTGTMAAGLATPWIGRSIGFAVVSYQPGVELRMSSVGVPVTVLP